MNQYGLIGYPLTHSFSQGFFNDKFHAELIDARYDNYEIPSIMEFENLISNNQELRGLNVTIPYKEQVINYLDELDPVAAEIGAVNVVKFINRDGKRILKGYNSDVIGFSRSIEYQLKRDHRAALILGTGGSSKAVKYALEKLGLETLSVSRYPQQGEINYQQITKELLQEYTVIVNTTPLGMYPKVDDAPSIPYEYLCDDHLLYDLLYNPSETKFLQLGKAKGAKTVNGLEMLLLQAEASWEIWNNEEN
ncbi:MAG: shikimate dehydrogenase family protein [Bacteroidales bacterium]